jgi:hypothetical protein
MGLMGLRESARGAYWSLSSAAFNGHEEARMTLAGRVLAGAATMAIMVGSATAANAQMIGATVPDWNGLYVGGYGGVLFVPGGSGGAMATGAQFGFNFVRGSFVGGFEVQPGAIEVTGTAAALILFNARAGFLAGQRAMVFGEAGLLMIPGLAGIGISAGAGVEFGLNNHLSASFELKGLSGLSPGPPLFDAYLIQWGLNWHP